MKKQARKAKPKKALPKAVAKKKKLVARRPPEKKKPAAPVTKKTTLAVKKPKVQVLQMRGSGLVELAIAADRERRDPTHAPKPLTRAQIAQLAMPDGG